MTMLPLPCSVPAEGENESMLAPMGETAVAATARKEATASHRR